MPWRDSLLLLLLLLKASWWWRRWRLWVRAGGDGVEGVWLLLVRGAQRAGKSALGA